ncbi:MAG: PEP-CTERM sorting domain-containing protein, partial [bacterium]|nr:PEP-CTERM sorting domain-containing protein [bacterium]
LTGAVYDPLTDYGLNPVYGRISGEAGVVPEPATMSLLAIGGLAMLRRRRKS